MFQLYEAEKMAPKNTHKDDGIYLEEGKLVLDTVQKRIAAEISLQVGNLARQENRLLKECFACARRLRADPSYWKRENELKDAKDNYNFFLAAMEPLRKERPLKELQADLKELETIEKTLSITDPEYAKIMTYIEKRTEEINLLKTEITEHYDTSLQKLEALSTAQANASSPWKGNYSHNSVADLLSVFVNKKASVTEESLLLLKNTIELVQKNPARAEKLVQRVKDEFAQQERIAAHKQAPSTQKDEAHTLPEQNVSEDEKRHGLK